MSETRPVAAAMWMLAAMLVIGVIDNFIFLIAEVISIWQLYVLRMAVAVPIIALAAYSTGQRLLPHKWAAVALRSFLVAGAMLFYFISLAFQPIAQSLAGLFTSPIIVVVITALFLREKIGVFRIGAVIAGFVGTLIVLQVSPQNFSAGSLVPVIGGVFYALGAVVTRRTCWGETTHALLASVMTMQGVIGLLGIAVLTLFSIPETPGALMFVTRGWVWSVAGIEAVLAVQILGSIVGVFALTRAYQLGEASFVAIFEYSVMIFGPLFAYLWFGQTLEAVQMAGIVLIIAAGAVIALRSRRA